MAHHVTIESLGWGEGSGIGPSAYRANCMICDWAGERHEVYGPHLCAITAYDSAFADLRQHERETTPSPTTN